MFAIRTFGEEQDGRQPTGRQRCHRDTLASLARALITAQSSCAAIQSPGENMMGYTTVTIPPSGWGNDKP